MKDSLKYFLLWQKKRDELPISDDPQADWAQMQSLLDVHLPVKRPGGFTRLKTMPAIFITFSAAAMIFLAGSIYHLEKKHRHAGKDHFRKDNPAQPGQAIADSLSRTAAKAYKDSLLSNGNNATAQDSTGADGKPAGSAAAIPTTTGNAKNTLLAATTKSGGRLAGSSSPVNQSAVGRRNNGSPQKKVANNKTGYGGNGAVAHGSHSIIPGHDSSNQIKAADQTTGSNDATNYNNAAQKMAATVAFNNRKSDGTLPPVLLPLLKVDLNLNKIQPPSLSRLSGAVNKAPAFAGGQTKGNKKDKPIKLKSTTPSNIDWGLLLGVNTSGSFTPKSQNANFYGSAPIDLYFGLFASYKINSNWAIAPQVRLFSPQNIVTAYTHANQSKVDSNQSLSITASRKMYAVSVPVYAVYNTGAGLSFKAGPVINFPVKQINASSILLPYNIRTDTTYYKNISTILNATKYQQSINFGFSAGASYQYKRFIFEATYLKSLSGYGVTNGLGSYKSNNGTFQFTIGFQLDKVKP